MKRVISVVMALVLSFGLFACGSGSKYAGTYEGTLSIDPYYANQHDNEGTVKIVLNSDGTGTFVAQYTEDVTVYNSNNGTDLLFSVKAGDEYASGTLTWSESDEYLVISFSGQERKVHGGQESISYSGTYELKGNVLEMIGGTGRLFQYAGIMNGKFAKK